MLVHMKGEMATKVEEPVDKLCILSDRAMERDLVVVDS
jgi:hypothetical protein